jgi:hypothetical protein
MNRCDDCGICEKTPIHFPGPHCKLEQPAIEALLESYGEINSVPYQLVCINTRSNKAVFRHMSTGEMANILMRKNSRPA